MYQLLNSTKTNWRLPRAWSQLSSLVLMMLLLPVAVFSQADFVLNGPDQVNQGETFDVVIEVQAGSQQIDLAEIHLNFDPNALQVNSITFEASSLLPSPLILATSDNAAGTVDAAYGNFSSFPSGTFDFLTINFTAQDVDADIISDLTFNFVFPKETIMTFGGNNVLDEANPKSIAIIDTDAPELPTELYINAGDEDITAPNVDGMDKTFISNDELFTNEANTVNTSADINGVEGTLEDLFQSEYFAGGNNDLIFSAPIANGTYIVDIYLVESFFGVATSNSAQNNAEAGSRLFDIQIEGGNLEADNVDLFAQFGPANPAILSFPVEVTDETLDITFLDQVANNPKVNAIAVRSGNQPGITFPTLAAINDVSISANETETIDLVANGQTGFDFIVTNTSGVVQSGQNFVSLDGNQIQINPNGGNVGEFIVTASVFNSEGGSAAQAFNLTITESTTANTAPTLNLNTDPKQVNEGASLNVPFTASDSETPEQVNVEAAIEGPDDNASVSIVDNNIVVSTQDGSGGNTYTVTVTATDPDEASDVATFTVDVIAPVTLPTEVYINVGGDEYTTVGDLLNAPAGTTFQADDFFANGGAFDNNNEIAGTEDDLLFQTERFNANLTYNVPVQNGTYSVTLYFAELFFGVSPGASGARVFDIDVDGDGSTEDVNIFERIGPLKAGAIAFNNIQVDDQSLDIILSASSNNGKLSAICIQQGNGTVDTQAPDITLNGENPLNLNVGDTYNEPGATAQDNIDGNLTAQLVIDNSAVNTSVAGNYLVSYTSTDLAGNTNTVNRTVSVSTAPPTGEPQALVQINTPNNNILNSSTFGGGFIIENTSPVGSNQEITSVTFDLSTAVYPNMVFDPAGTAGDALGGGLEAVSGAVVTGFMVPANDEVDPFSDPRGNGGFDRATVNFNDFEPGESFEFKVDVDPTSIEGGSTEGNAGAVSGLELLGATVTVTFNGNNTLPSVRTFRIENSNKGSQNIAKTTAPNADLFLDLGVSTITNGRFQDVVTDNPNFDNAFLIDNFGENNNAEVEITILKSELDLAGSSNTVDDMFEANKVVAVDEIITNIGGTSTPIGIELENAENGDLFYVVAAIRNADGSASELTDIYRVKIDNIPPPTSQLLFFNEAEEEITEIDVTLVQGEQIELLIGVELDNSDKPFNTDNSENVSWIAASSSFSGPDGGLNTVFVNTSDGEGGELAPGEYTGQLTSQGFFSDLEAEGIILDGVLTVNLTVLPVSPPTSQLLFFNEAEEEITEIDVTLVQGEQIELLIGVELDNSDEPFNTDNSENVSWIAASSSFSGPDGGLNTIFVNTSDGEGGELAPGEYTGQLTSQGFFSDLEAEAIILDGVLTVNLTVLPATTTRQIVYRDANDNIIQNNVLNLSVVQGTNLQTALFLELDNGEEGFSTSNEVDGDFIAVSSSFNGGFNDLFIDATNLPLGISTGTITSEAFFNFENPNEVIETGVLTVNVNVTPASTAPQVTALNVINAQTNQFAFTLENGDEIDLNDFPGGFTIEAVANGQTESVQFSGASDRSENVPPYAAAGDSPLGDFIALNLGTGNFTITATPFALNNTAGDPGQALTRNFSVIQGITPPPPPNGFPRLVLINTATQQVIGLVNGATIDRDDLDQRGIVLETQPNNIGALVTFQLNGLFAKTEGLPPYSIAGDNNANGNIFPITQEANAISRVVDGNNTVRAFGGAIDISATFTVEDDGITPPPSGAVLNLVNTNNNAVIGNLAGATIDINDVDERGIVFVPAGSISGNVIFTLNGQFANAESVAPFSIAGDVGNNINPLTTELRDAGSPSDKLVNGTNTLTVTNNGATLLSVQFTVVGGITPPPSDFPRFEIVNTSNQDEIGNLSGATINTSQLSQRGIVLKTQPANLNTVITFQLNGVNVAFEGQIPYSLAGDINNGNTIKALSTSNPVLSNLQSGSNTLRAFGGGIDLTVNFNIAGGLSARATEPQAADTGEEIASPNVMNTYPNPFSQGAVFVEMSSEVKGFVNYSVVDASGRVVATGRLDAGAGKSRLEIDLTGKSLSQGTLYLRLEGENLQTIQRLQKR